MASREDFFNLWNAGYRRLVPIIPPDAEISPASSLARRPKSIGKAPGVLGRDGFWRGFDWLKHETVESDLTQWALSGAGIGIRTGSGLAGVDVDTKNPDLCVVIAEKIRTLLGNGAVRIGDAPKFLVLFRTYDDVPYERIEFSDGLHKPDGKPSMPRVEILTEGRQFVAVGVHPDTRKPYHWPKSIKALHELPVISRQQVRAFFEALADVLPAAHRPVVEAASREVPAQHTLKGDPEHVRKAIAALPNTVELFPTYDDYVRVGAAIKAALADDSGAEQLFLQWAGRWEGGDFSAERAIADFRRIKPPYKVGAGWLYDQTERYAVDGAFSRTSLFFSAVDESTIDGTPDIFAQADEANRKREQRAAAIIWTDPLEWEGRNPPPRKWIVDGLVPAGEVTLLTGAGGVGKTLLAQQMAACINTGLPFLGCQTSQERSLLFLCEDDDNELNRRQRDINSVLGVTFEQLAGRTRIASRKHSDNLLVTFDRQTGKMIPTPLWHAIMRSVEEFQPGLVVLDTIADIFGGSEIDRQQVRQFVQAAMGAYCAATGCAVLLLGHPSRAGESSGEGTSGSTAWHASVRSRLYLTHATKDGAGPNRLLTSKKANYGPSGAQWLLKWERGAFLPLSASQAATLAGTVPDTEDVLDAAVLHHLADLFALSVRTTLNQRSAAYAVKALRQYAAQAFIIYTDEQLTAAVQRLTEQHRIEERPGVLSSGRGSVSTIVLVDQPPTDLFD